MLDYQVDTELLVECSQIVNNDGSSTESDKETANALNGFFTSVYIHEPTGILLMFKDKLDELNKKHTSNKIK